MKLLFERFEDEIFEDLKRQKQMSGKTWHDFMIDAGNAWEIMKRCEDDLK